MNIHTYSMHSGIDRNMYPNVRLARVELLSIVIADDRLRQLVLAQQREVKRMRIAEDQDLAGDTAFPQLDRLRDRCDTECIDTHRIQ